MGGGGFAARGGRTHSVVYLIWRLAIDHHAFLSRRSEGEGEQGGVGGVDVASTKVLKQLLTLNNNPIPNPDLTSNTNPRCCAARENEGGLDGRGEGGGRGRAVY